MADSTERLMVVRKAALLAVRWAPKKAGRMEVKRVVKTVDWKAEYLANSTVGMTVDWKAERLA